MTSPGYARIPGDDGLVVPVNDSPPGLPLDRACATGRPTARAVLEVGAAVADILVAAAREGAAHGDLRLSRVRIAADGTVVVEGFDTARLAVGGHTEAADVEATGRILRGLFAAGGSEADWGPMAEAPWFPEVKRFLSALVAPRPEDRPSAVDAALVLSRAAERATGDGLVAWATRAGAPPPPAALKAASGWPAASRTEVAGAQWSAERLARVFGDPRPDLAAVPARPPSPPAAPAAPAGGSRTWSPDDAAPPSRPAPRPFSAAPTLVFPLDANDATGAGPGPPPKPPAPPAAATTPNRPPPPPPAPPAAAPPAPSPTAAGWPPAHATPPERARSRWPMLLAGGCFVLALLGCLGLVAAGGAYCLLGAAAPVGEPRPEASPAANGAILSGLAPPPDGPSAVARPATFVGSPAGGALAGVR